MERLKKINSYVEFDKSDKLLKLIIENSNDGILIIDDSYKILFANQKLYNLSGFTSKEIIGKDFRSFLDKSTSEVISERYKKRQKGEQVPSIYEVRLTKKDGTIRDVELTSLTVKDANEKPITITQIFDISQRKKTEKALAESENKFRSLSEKSLVGVYLIQDGIFKYCNPKLAEIFGYSLPDVINKLGPQNLVYPDDIKIVQENLNKRLSQEVDSIQYDFRGVKNNGDIIYVEVFGSKTIYDGKPAVIGTLLDITKRKSIERDLEYKNKFESLITKFSARFINIKSKRIRKDIFSALKQIAKITKDDRCYLYLFDEKLTTINLFTQWTKSKSKSTNDHVEHIEVVSNRNWLSKLKTDKIYKISSIRDIPKSDLKLKKDLQKLGISSFIDVPITHKGTLKGFLGLANHDEDCNWDPLTVSLLKLAGEIFINAIERDKIENELRESEERFRSIYENSTIGIFRANIDGHPIMANPAYLKILGFSSLNELQQIGDVENLYKDVSFQDNIISKLIEFKTISGLEINMKKRNGRIIPIRLNARLIKSKTDKYIEGSIEDLSIQKNTENIFKNIALGVSSKTGESFFKYLVDFIGKTLDINVVIVGKVDSSQENIKTLAIWKNGKIIKNKLYTLEGTPCDNLMEQSFCYYPKDIQTLFPLDNFFKENDLHSYMGTPLINSEGKPIGILSVLGKTELDNPDIAESILKIFAERCTSEIERMAAHEKVIDAKETAERANQLKTEFLAQMSHEIRTPINTILSFASLLKEEVMDKISGDMQSCFSVMQNSGKRIIRTIDMILNMSEIQTGTYETNITSFDLYDNILEPLFHEYSFVAKEKGLKLIINNKTKDYNISADEYTVGQIFNNLIDNAIKYTKEGTISIKISKTKAGKITTEVKDTGIGISKLYLPNLFQPFSQEDQGYTRKFEGNGLGLALVKKYCELNNSEITVDSTKGVGTKFKVIFN